MNEQEVNTEPLNLNERILTWIRAAAPKITKARSEKWPRMYYCIGVKLTALGIRNFALRPDSRGDYVEVMYESAHRKASDELDKELKKIYGKIKMCVQEAGVKAFQVRGYKKLPKSGGGEDLPLNVLP